MLFCDTGTRRRDYIFMAGLKALGLDL